MVVLYIAEAHAEDIWPIGGLYPTMSHKSVKDRINASKRMREILCWEERDGDLFIDNMEDEFLEKYGAWPIGLFVFSLGRLEWRAKPRNSTIEIEDIIKFFDNKKIL